MQDDMQCDIIKIGGIVRNKVGAAALPRLVPRAERHAVAVRCRPRSGAGLQL
jgi:hypothetical protein